MMSAGERLTAYARTAGPRDPRLRGAVAVIVLVFSCSLIVFVVSGLLRGDTGILKGLQVGVPMMIVDGLIAFQLIFLLRRTVRMKPVARWSLIALGILAVALLQSAWDTQLRLWSGILTGEAEAMRLAFVRSLTLNFYHTGMVTALLAFQATNQSLRQKQRQLSASRASERDAHMLALRFQLNPHFLFNTLNAISSLIIVGRAAEAEEMIDRLSSFLRSSLTADPRNLVRLDEEFDMLESYLEIEGVRFGERLVATMELPPEVSGALIPAFLLQPIVENAIKYAVAPASRPVSIRIAAEERGGELILSVNDDGDGCGDVLPGTGVGLANVTERLKLRYGGRAKLDKRQDGKGCCVEIRMPLEREDAALERATKAPVFA